MEDSSIWENPFLLEMKCAQIISSQAKHGVNFNRRKAQFGIHILKERIVNIDKVLVPLLPPMFNTGTSYKKPFLISGKLSKSVQVYSDKHGLDTSSIGGPFTAVWYTPFDTSKIAKLKIVMSNLGWEPSIWNSKKNPLQELNKLPPHARITAKKEMVNKYIFNNILGNGDAYKELILKELKYGNRKRNIGNLFDFIKDAAYWPSSPKITPDSDKFKGGGETLDLIRNRMVWAHRRSLLEGLVRNVRPDGKLSAEAISCATPTARMRHRVVVNIPAARAPFGPYCRSLFVGDKDKTLVKPTIYTQELKEGQRVKVWSNRIEEFDKKKGKWVVKHWHKQLIPRGQQVFVGYDGAGLELRMLAHFVGDEEYTRQILEGDIHTYNQTLAGLPTRDSAKTFIYAFNYGAGDAKLGSIVGGGAREGAEIRARFLKANPKLKALIEKAKADGEKGYVYGVDGRKLWLRRGYDGKYQTHKALNVLLQGAGAIVMKYGMAILDKEVKMTDIRANKCLDIHDEGQWSCHPDDVSKLRALMDTCITKAGTLLTLRCPLASDSIQGLSWLDTH